MSQDSIEYSVVKSHGNPIERFYTASVKWIQNTFVRADVWIDAKKGRHEGRKPDAALTQRLMDLALDPERIWWGPLTLKAEKIRYLLEEIESHPPKRVIEMGSGASTALFAALGEKYDFEVYSIENHPDSVYYVNHLLEGLPCARRVHMQQCGFVRKKLPNGKGYWWFDMDLEAFGGKFDFVFIDAPMGQLAGRLGSLPELAPWLADEHRVYLDDSDRPDEQAFLGIWKTLYPDLSVTAADNCRDIVKLSLAKPLP